MRFSKRPPLSRHSMRGYTLIEMGIVIALLAVAVALIYRTYQDRKDSNIASETAAQFTQMAADSQSRFSQQGNYTGASAATLISNGIVPGTMVSGTTINTRWNTPVAVAATNLNGSAGDGLEFTFTVPRKSCSDFVSQASASAARSTVGGTSVKNIPGGVNNVNVAALGEACNSTAAGNVAVALAITR